MMLTFSSKNHCAISKASRFAATAVVHLTVFIYVLFLSQLWTQRFMIDALMSKLLFISFAKVIHFIVMVSYFSPLRINPFAHIRLRKTVTNDRSAPIIEWGSYRHSSTCVPCGVSFHLNIRLKTGNSPVGSCWLYSCVIYFFCFF